MAKKTRSQLNAMTLLKVNFRVAATETCSSCINKNPIDGDKVMQCVQFLDIDEQGELIENEDRPVPFVASSWVCDNYEDDGQ